MEKRIVRIYKQSRNLMQSGNTKNKSWVLEFYKTSPSYFSNIANWVSSSDPDTQVRIKFPNLESAVNYATKKKLTYNITTTETHHCGKPKSYADIFKSRTEF